MENIKSNRKLRVDLQNDNIKDCKMNFNKNNKLNSEGLNANRNG